ncbi:hypothetical protein Acr_23g0000630 [Actinidia rufa]|uniref:Uncharacterized protein n=1 Tax=Actinidia rufa TaxID=165716 RepID=A0A7J0GLR9_9ERIC|nr:hypothetical protein Acr_23g0000630 [Actinidia rufa]
MGEELTLYLSVSPIAMSAMLIKEEHIVQRPAYYVNKVLLGAPRLLDFIVEFTYSEEDDTPIPDVELAKGGETKENIGDTARWKLFEDSSSNQHGYGVGLILRTPSSEQKEYAIHIEFKATNNEAEYETLPSELRVAIEFGIPQEKNKQVDIVANLASTFNFTTDRNVPIKFLPKSSIDIAKTNVCQATVEPTWIDDITGYIESGELSFGETPYSVYEIESVIPVKIGMPSFYTLNFNKKINEIELRLNLDLLVEKRERAQMRQVAYEHQMEKDFNMRVKHQAFQPGDLVLREFTLATKELNTRKLSPTWEGPHKAVRFSGHELIG